VKEFFKDFDKLKRGVITGDKVII